MLATNSIELKKTTTFDEAFSLIPENEKTKVRYLYEKEGRSYKPTNIAQLSFDEGNTWSSVKTCKYDKDGQMIPVDLNSKAKLKNANLFYDVFTTPTLAGADQKNSWLIGNIDGCKIMGDEYSIQGMIISSIFDPNPKYYISFERIICQNQFSTLGKNNASMYIDMSYFLNKENHSQENRERLISMIQAESEKRIDEANRVYERLATTHLSDTQIARMFQMLTTDKVAKKNEEKYHEAEIEYEKYMKVYTADDNQNFKNSLFGFVNACTNINTRTRTNPLDVLKPVLPADVIDAPCNFDYLCRAAVLQNIA